MGRLVVTEFIAAHGLVDHYRLMVFPVLLGTDKRLFGGDDGGVPKPTLRLTESTPVGPNGVIVLTHEPTH